MNSFFPEIGNTGIKNRVNQSRACIGTRLVLCLHAGHIVITGCSGRAETMLRHPKRMMNPRRLGRLVFIRDSEPTRLHMIMQIQSIASTLHLT
jgi:hypothetical protein